MLALADVVRRHGPDYLARYGTKMVGPRIRELLERAHAVTPGDYEALLTE